MPKIHVKCLLSAIEHQYQRFDPLGFNSWQKRQYANGGGIVKRYQRRNLPVIFLTDRTFPGSHTTHHYMKAVCSKWPDILWPQYNALYSNKVSKPAVCTNIRCMVSLSTIDLTRSVHGCDHSSLCLPSMHYFIVIVTTITGMFTSMASTFDPKI